MISRPVHVHLSGTSGPKRTEVRVGYDLAPVQLDTRGKNRVLIGLGSYLVNAQSIRSDREISDRDRRAVYEYLSAIRPRPDFPNSGF